MSVHVQIPTPLRMYAGNQSTVEVSGGTVSEALDDLVRRHESIRKHLLDEAGAVRSFVNVYVNDEDVRHLEQSGTAVKEGDVITIVPSVAGGRT